MQFSKTELKVLEQLALGKKQITAIAKALDKDKSQIYRIIKSLSEKGFLSLHNKKIKPSEKIHVQILLQELSKQSSFINDISGCGLKLYLCIQKNPKTLQEIEQETSIKPSTFFLKLKTARKKSLIRTIENKYVFNSDFWSELNEFFTQLKKYEEVVDNRIPAGSVIYYKNDKEIVFSTKAQVDATLTGFSAYDRYGIKIYTIDNDYYLPQKELTIKEVFTHSLYRTEKEKSIQNLIILSLFYVKHKEKLSEISHKILENINKLLQGNEIQGYPLLSEIKERAEIYDIII
jgi:transposase